MKSLSDAAHFDGEPNDGVVELSSCQAPWLSLATSAHTHTDARADADTEGDTEADAEDEGGQTMGAGGGERQGGEEEQQQQQRRVIFKESAPHPWYLAAVNHLDGSCRNGNGVWGEDRQPCRWYGHRN